MSIPTAALTEALRDEYKARATCRAVIRPFTKRAATYAARRREGRRR